MLPHSTVLEEEKVANDLFFGSVFRYSSVKRNSPLGFRSHKHREQTPWPGRLPGKQNIEPTECTENSSECKHSHPRKITAINIVRQIQDSKCHVSSRNEGGMKPGLFIYMLVAALYQEGQMTSYAPKNLLPTWRSSILIYISNPIHSVWEGHKGHSKSSSPYKCWSFQTLSLCISVASSAHRVEGWKHK